MCSVVQDKRNFYNDRVCYDQLRRRLLNNPNIRDLCTKFRGFPTRMVYPDCRYTILLGNPPNGTMNSNYRPNDFLRPNKAHMYHAEYVHSCVSLSLKRLVFLSISKKSPSQGCCYLLSCRRHTHCRSHGQFSVFTYAPSWGFFDFENFPLSNVKGLSEVPCISTN